MGKKSREKRILYCGGNPFLCHIADNVRWGFKVSDTGISTIYA
jgi:hypothetical protein